MKKLFVCLFAISCMALSANAEIGIGIKGGGGADDNNLKKVFITNPYNYEEDENSGIFGLEALYQQAGLFNLSQDNVLGAKIAWENHGEIKYTDYDYNDSLAVNIYKFPVTVFYKYAPQDTKFNIWGGAGFTVAFVNWEAKDIGAGTSADQDNTKVYPHIKGGVEWRPNKTFGLGLDLGYNFGTEFNLGTAYRDIKGFDASLAARFYFL